MKKMPVEIRKWACPYCEKQWDTEEEAKSCAKYPYEILKEGDVLDWKAYRYGKVTHVHPETDWPGFNADKNRDYVLALGMATKDFFNHSGVCYPGLVCGGPEVHKDLLFKLGDAEDLVAVLRKRLKHAESLLADVRAMCERRKREAASSEASQ